MVSTLIKEACVALKLKKCAFFSNSIDQFSHLIKRGRHGAAVCTADAICNLKVPTTVTELRSFLGVCNVFRQFVPSFIIVELPPFKRLKEPEREKNWTS